MWEKKPLALLALLALLAGCGRDFVMPPPPGGSGVDTDPPTFATWTLVPEVAGSGTTVTLGFVSDELLPAGARTGDNPEVTLGGAVVGSMRCTEPSPRTFSCSMVVPPGTPDGAVTFSVVGTDAAGNENAPIEAPLTLRVDATAPTLGILAATRSGVLGSNLSFTLTADEALGDAHLEASFFSAPAVCQQATGTDWICSGTVSTTAPIGDAPFEAVGHDLAGNEGRAGGSILLLAPDLFLLSPTVSPEVAKVGDEVVFGYDTSQEIISCSTKIEPGGTAQAAACVVGVRHCTCRATMNGFLTEGAVTVELGAVNSGGNATITVPLQLDKTAPVLDGNLLVFLQRPANLPDAAEGRVGAVVEAGAPYPARAVSWLRVFDAAIGGSLLARATVSGDGSFGPLDLGPTALNSIWLEAEDLPGNVSARMRAGRLLEDLSPAGRVPYDPSSGPVALSAFVSESDPTSLDPAAAAAFHGESSTPELVGDADGTELVSSAAAARVDGPVRAIPQHPADRTAHEMVYDAARQRVFIWGGASWQGEPPERTWAWDGTTWTHVNSILHPPQRDGGASAYDPLRQRVIFFGGRLGPPSWSWYDETWEFDGSQWSVAATAAPTTGHRFEAAMAWDGNRQQVILFGGPGGAAGQDSVFGWDGNTWSDLGIPTGPAWRQSASLCWDGTHNEVLLFGGAGLSGYATTTWALTATGWVQKSPTTSPSPRTNAPMAWDAALAVVYLYGGTRKVGGRVDDLWRWSGTDWSLVETGGLPAERGDHGLVYDAARQQLLLDGGYSANNPTDQTFLWDGSSWSLASTGTWPLKDARPQAVWDPRRQVVTLIVGGSFEGVTQVEAYDWDGAIWSRRNTTGAPPARADHAAAYDVRRGVIVLYGGTGLSDTFELSGNTWTRATPTTDPGVRARHTMAYDATRQRVVLYGGEGSGASSSVWEYDGIDWTETVLTGPPGTRSAGMTWDPTLGQVVHFAGRTSGSPYDQALSSWDGTTWSPLPTVVTLAGRGSMGLAWDPVRSSLITFGGQNNLTAPFALGEYLSHEGGDWLDLTPTPARTIAVSGYALAYHHAARQLVSYGGQYHFRDTLVIEEPRSHPRTPSHLLEVTLPTTTPPESLTLHWIGAGLGDADGADAVGDPEVFFWIWHESTRAWVLVGSSGVGQLEQALTIPAPADLRGGKLFLLVTSLPSSTTQDLGAELRTDLLTLLVERATP